MNLKLAETVRWLTFDVCIHFNDILDNTFAESERERERDDDFTLF